VLLVRVRVRVRVETRVRVGLGLGLGLEPARAPLEALLGAWGCRMGSRLARMVAGWHVWLQAGTYGCRLARMVTR
jgi:hypothetical protein